MSSLCKPCRGCDCCCSLFPCLCICSMFSLSSLRRLFLMELCSCRGSVTRVCLLFILHFFLCLFPGEIGVLGWPFFCTSFILMRWISRSADNQFNMVYRRLIRLRALFYLSSFVEGYLLFLWFFAICSRTRKVKVVLLLVSLFISLRGTLISSIFSIFVQVIARSVA